MTLADDLRRDPADVPRVLRGARPPAAALGVADPGRARPLGAVHGRGHAAAEAVLPGRRAAAAPARHDLPEDVPHRRHRDHRHDHAPSDVLRDARQLLVRRLLQARGGRGSPGSSRPRASASRPTTSGSPCSAATTSSASAPTRRRSRPGSRSASRASGSSSARARRTSGRSAPTGPCGPCSELYLDRGVELGKPDDLPGGDNERFLEYWNLVFMQFDQNPANALDAAAGQEHRHRPRPQPDGRDPPGQGDGVRDRPVRAADRARRGAVGPALRRGLPDRPALRVLADHGRAMTFLIADGVVPSNEDRGYVLRRIMRRAIQQGRSARARARASCSRYADAVTELMGAAYPRAARAARRRSRAGSRPRRSASATRSSRA